MNLKLKEKIKESLSAVLPITGIVLMLSIFLVPMELGSIVMFLTGAVMLIVGMGFFQLGAEMAMTPIGEGVGVQISKMKKLITVLLTGFVMGVIITVSEPDLQVLAGQVPSVPNAVLIMTVAIGVGLFLALAIVRIRYKISLPLLLIICYAALILISLFVPKEFLAVAFDSGGVASGPMTATFTFATTSCALRPTTAKNRNGSGTITIDGSGSETINGATTLALTTQWSVATLHCDGAAWYRL